MAYPLNPRDERGWRIPKDGTLSRQVYDLMVQGKTPKQIHEAIPTRSYTTLRVMAWRIRYPHMHNEASKRYNAKSSLRERYPHWFTDPA